MLEAKTIRKIQADEISEAVDEIVEIKPETFSYKSAFNELMEADEIFKHLEKMCEVTE
jgi:hypothetical protein